MSDQKTPFLSVLTQRTLRDLPLQCVSAIDGHQFIWTHPPPLTHWRAFLNSCQHLDIAASYASSALYAAEPLLLVLRSRSYGDSGSQVTPALPMPCSVAKRGRHVCAKMWGRHMGDQVRSRENLFTQSLNKSWAFGVCGSAVYCSKYCFHAGQSHYKDNPFLGQAYKNNLRPFKFANRTCKSIFD